MFAYAKKRIPTNLYVELRVCVKIEMKQCSVELVHKSRIVIMASFHIKFCYWERHYNNVDFILAANRLQKNEESV